MTTTQIGWTLPDNAFAIKQGSSGAIEFDAVVTKQDGTALDSYDGAVASIKLFRNPQDAAPELTFAPSVVGDAPNKTFKIKWTLAPGDTATRSVGQLVGDVKVTDTNGGIYFASEIALNIERSYS